MAEVLRVISPVDGSVYAERPLADAGAARDALERARAAQREWRETAIVDRAAVVREAVARFVAKPTSWHGVTARAGHMC